MKLRSSFLCQLHDHLSAVCVYYGVLVAIILLSLLSVPFSGDANFTVGSGGITAVTMIFLFIVSLCAFKDSFLLNLQYGTSRRTQYLARLGAMVAVSAGLAVADELYTLLIFLLGFVMPDHFMGYSLYQLSYSEGIFDSREPFGIIYSIGTNPTTILCSVLFSFFLLLAVCSFGYFIAVLNYRLNKTGKILFWCGWPSFLIFTRTFLWAHLRQLEPFVTSVLTNLGWLCFSTLPRFCVTCTLLAALFSGITYLLMRRAVVK